MGLKALKWIRVVTAAMLVTMVYYFAGYRLVYFMLMHGAKADAAFVMQSKVASLQTISFTAKEYNALQWTDKNKEFSWHEQLYDIASVSKSGNNYVLKVYADKNETMWAKALNNFVKEVFPATEKSSKSAENLMSAFQKEYMPVEKLNLGMHAPLLLIYPLSDSKPVVENMNADIWHPPALC